MLYVQAGWDLLERVRLDAVARESPVIVVSTTPALLDEAQADTLRYGGQRFLVKPFDIDDLYAAVEELIGMA